MPQCFDVQGEYTEERASGDNAVPSPVYEGARTCEYGTTVPPPCYQPFKVEDGAMLLGMSLICPHGHSNTQVIIDRTGPRGLDRGCRASHYNIIYNR